MKVFAINVNRNSGVSTKKDPSGRPYEMASLQMLTDFEPGEGSKADGSSWKREGYGKQVIEIPLKPEALREFKDVAFPCEIELITDSEIIFGRMTTVVVGLSKPSSVRAA